MCHHSKCQLLPNDLIGGMFNETLDENDCKYQDKQKFLNLLQDKDQNRRTKQLQWEWIVKNAKTNITFNILQ